MRSYDPVALLIVVYRLLQLVDLPMLDMLRSHELRSCDLGDIVMYSNSKRPCLNDSCDLPQNILTAMKYLENCKLILEVFGERFIKEYLANAFGERYIKEYLTYVINATVI